MVMVGNKERDFPASFGFESFELVTTGFVVATGCGALWACHGKVTEAGAGTGAGATVTVTGWTI